MKTREFPKSWPLMVAVIGSLAVLGAGVEPAQGHSGLVFSAFVSSPPGSPAACFSTGAVAPLDLPDRVGAVCVENTIDTLFVVLSLPDLAMDPRDGFVLFDDNHNGVAEPGEDGLRLKLSGGGSQFQDQYRTSLAPLPCSVEGPFGALDICDGGTTDGSAFTVASGMNAVFFFAHPLKSFDSKHDIQVECATPRQVLGANFGARAFFETPPTTKGGFAYPINDPSKWDDIKIACQGDPRESPLGNRVLSFADEIGKLPDTAFVNNPDERRTALLFKIDEVYQMVQRADYLPAANKLANDILPKLNPDGKNCWACIVGPNCYQNGLALLADIQAVQGVVPDPHIGVVR